MGKKKRKARQRQEELQNQQVKLQNEQLDELRGHRKSGKLGITLTGAAIILALVLWYFPRQVPSLSQSQEQRLDSVPPIQTDSAIYVIPRTELDTIAAIIRQRLDEGEEVTSTRLVQVGNSFVTHRDQEEALYYFRQAMLQPDFNTVEMVRLAVLFNLASVHCKLENYDSCLSYREQALTLTPVQVHPTIRANLLNGIGNVILGRGLADSALTLYTAARSIYKELGETSRVREIDGNIANVHYFSGDYREALSGYRSLESVFMQGGLADTRDSNEYANTLHHIGLMHFTRDSLTESLEYYRQALSMYTTLGVVAGIAQELSAIGMIFGRSGQTDSAIYYIVLALEKNRTIPSTDGEANCLGNLGNIYMTLGQRQEALNHFHQSLALHSSIRYRQGEAIALAQIGYLYEREGEVDSSIHYFEKSYSVSERYGLFYNRTQVFERLYILRAKKRGLL